MSEQPLLQVHNLKTYLHILQDGITPDQMSWDMFIMGSGGDSDADTLLKRIMHSADTNVNNYGFYNNAEVDELLEKGAVTMDETERNAIYARIAQITMYEDPFGAYMNLRKSVYALSDKIEGLAVTPPNTLQRAHGRGVYKPKLFFTPGGGWFPRPPAAPPKKKTS